MWAKQHNDEYFARAEYDFSTQQAGDMSFRANEIIYVTKSVDANWLFGCSLNGLQSGMFPSNFVSKLVLPDPSTLTAGQQILVCTSAFLSQQTGDLSLGTDQLIFGRQKIDENWWEGALLDPKGHVTAQKGIFPANYVTELGIPPMLSSQSSSSIQNNPVASVPCDVIAKARVLSSLKAQLPEEIDLFENETVSVTEYVDSMWWKGVSQDGTRRGLFPKRFVKILEEHKPVFQTPKASSPPRYPPPPLPDSILDLSNDELAPYGRSKYAFKAEFGNELAFPAGEIIKLLRHVDDEWTEGEFKGKIGIFPTSYVDIIVDCVALTPPPTLSSLMDSGYVSGSSETFNQRDSVSTSPPLTRNTDSRLVLYDFQSKERDDLPVKAGQKILVVREVNADWVEACLTSDQSRIGLVPKSFIESPRPDSANGFSGPGQSRGLQANSGSLSPVRIRANGRKQQTWQKQMNRQSLDETISKNLAGLDIISRRQTEAQSTIVRQNYFSQGAISDNRTNTVVPFYLQSSHLQHQTERPSTDSDIFITPPTTPTPLADSQGNIASHHTPPPRPLNSPAIRNKSPLDPEREERERKEKEAARKVEQRLQREKVAAELVKSERAFVRDLEISIRCLSDTRGRIYSDGLLHGFREVNELSNRVLARLDQELTKDFHVQSFGEIFLEMEQEFRTVLDHFCEANDEAMVLLERHEHDSSAQATLKNCLLRMKQEGSNCLDISSVLSRPLNRMMKYPLFLSELLKCTEDTHLDKPKLFEAVRIMTEVAQCINETKRRKDLVHKYRKDSDVTFTERLSKLNLHSVRKKGSRFSVRMTRTMGLTSLVKDEAFEEAEREFRDVEKLVRHILKDIQVYCEQLQHSMVNQYSLAESWKDAWAKGGHSNVPESVKSDLRAYQDAWSKIAEILLPSLFQKVKERVRQPLNELNFMFHGPEKLIEKRGDKLLDYEAIAGNKGANESERTTKAEYEALNQQLLSEIPKLTVQAQEVVKVCVRSFLGAQRTFNNDLRASLAHLDHHNRSVDSVWPTFETRHKNALADLHALTCLTKTQTISAAEKLSTGNLGVNPPVSQQQSMRGSQRFKSYMKTPQRGNISFPQQPQTEADRNSLRAKWTAGGQLSRVFVAAVPQAGVNVELDLTVNKGDLLLALIQKDPMGNPDRWYMDNGSSKGFVPRAVLVPLSEQQSSAPRRPPLTELITPLPVPSQPVVNQSVSAAVKRQKSEGALIDLSDRKSSNSEQPSHLTDLVGLRLRSPSVTAQLRPGAPYNSMPSNCRPQNASRQEVAAPLVPARPIYDNVGYEMSTETRAMAKAKSKNNHITHNYQGPTPPLLPVQERAPVRSAPPPPTKAPPGGQNGRFSSKSDETEPADEDDYVEFYISEFEFDASDPNELSLKSGQIVAVHMKEDLQGNNEWWLVEDDSGGVGYAPANYFQPYQN